MAWIDPKKGDDLEPPEPNRRTLRIWLKALRIGFLPIGILIFAAMPVPILAGLNMLMTPAILIAIVLGALAHILWWAYGSLLNDYYDQDIDRHHPHGEKVFTMGYFSDAQKRRLVLGFAVVAALLEIPQVACILATHSNGLMDVAAFATVIGVGFVMGTMYSAPPLRTRVRMLGATYSLMFVFVIAFLRFAILVGCTGIRPK
jgi:4-hydroxybenzoate polyprenyltransferase